MMTVKELIEKLRQFPGDTPVFVHNDSAELELNADDVVLIPATENNPILQEYTRDWVCLEAHETAYSVIDLLGKES